MRILFAVFAPMSAHVNSLQTVDGVVLEDGSRLPYKMSGHAAFWTSLVAT